MGPIPGEDIDALRIRLPIKDHYLELLTGVNLFYLNPKVFTNISIAIQFWTHPEFRVLHLNNGLGHVCRLLCDQKGHDDTA